MNRVTQRFGTVHAALDLNVWLRRQLWHCSWCCFEHGTNSALPFSVTLSLAAKGKLVYKFDGLVVGFEQGFLCHVYCCDTSE